MNYWQKFFFPDNSFIFIGSNFNLKNLKEILNHYCLKYTKANNSIKFYDHYQDFQETGVFIRKDNSLKMCYIDTTFPSLVNIYSDKLDKLKQRIILLVLGGLRTSRLFKLLRYQEGLVYNVDAGSIQHTGYGYVYITAECFVDKLDQVLRLMSEEVKNILLHGLTSEELEVIKNFLKNDSMMNFDHPSSIAAWIHSDQLWMNNEVLLPEHHIKLLDLIDLKSLNQFMKNNWDIKKIQLCIQGPDLDSQKINNNYDALYQI